MRIVATAGHVDHGKSTLVRALTGTDPDRWPAEHERGLTIDLGFAVTEGPSGSVALVDVPGHRGFLGNMLAGVGAVDAVLLAVSAVEGWKAQSEEHLAIVELLGIRHGLVVLTHADRVDDARLAAVAATVAARLADGPLRGAELVATGVPAGHGLAELRAALDRLVGTAPAAADLGRPRLWVDRAFTIRGSGTIVTGTLTGGPLAVGQVVLTAPGGRSSRVRTIEVHGSARADVGPGHRVALNLPDLDLAHVGRGVALVEPDRWHPATTVDAELTALPAVDRPIGRRGAHLLHTGTGSWAVRLQGLSEPAVVPGTRGTVRIRLPEPLPLRPGDRFVLRDAGVDATVGGGVILDVDPVLPARQARPDLRWERVVDEHGWIEPAQLARTTGIRRPADVGRWIVSDAGRAATEVALRRRLEGAGPAGLPRSALDERTRALLDADRVTGVLVDGDHVRLAGDGDALADHPWLARLRADLFRPPPPDGVAPADLRALVARGLVVRRDGLLFHRDAVEATLTHVRRLAEERPGGVSVADVRAALGTSRRYALPLLAELDARGLTRRQGPLRVLVDRHR